MLRKQLSRAGLLVLSLVAAVVPLTTHALTPLVPDAPLWLSDQVPSVIKTEDLASGVVPRSTPTDCEMLQKPGLVEEHCVVRTPLGVYYNGTFDDGTHGILRSNFIFLPPGNSGMYFVTSGYSVGGYRTLSRSSLDWRSGKYTYSVPWDFKLLASNGAPASVAVDTLAFSSNGKYLVALAIAGTGDGIMVFDTETMKGKLIASLNGATIYDQTTPGAANLAVSDDGRFVASGYSEKPATGLEKGLRVYDTTTCTDQLLIASAKRNSCEYKNIWTGKMRGVQYSAGIKDQLAGNPERPLNLRFKGGQTITFSAIHDYASATDFKASAYEATIKPWVEPIRLLAMGDSYISGEGGFSYVDGTDTGNNKCHQSALSYPYLLGTQYATEYSSAACSGAVMRNIVDSDYLNQLIDPLAQNEYDIDKVVSTREVGVIRQLEYISKLKPNAILLSIGGNDIGFSDIVKRCVLSIAGNPCYNKKSERLSLLKTIYGKHEELVATYSKILSESPGGTKLYVVGYPEVINAAGNCGANVHFDDQERLFAVGLIAHLNATVKNAAESAGAIYVDTTRALDGHRLCDENDNGVNGLTVGDDTTALLPVKIGGFIFHIRLGFGNESYHPTTVGHRLLADSIANVTKSLTEEAKEPTNANRLAIDSKDSFVTMGNPDEAEARKIIFDTIIDNAAQTKEQPLKILSSGNGAIAPNAPYEVVIHSQELTLARGFADESGVVSAHIGIPDIAPGVHSLHIYTLDTEGEPIDIAQDILIAASADDYDGDGIKNIEDTLPLVNETEVIIAPEEPETPQGPGSVEEEPQKQVEPIEPIAGTAQKAQGITNVGVVQVSSAPPVFAATLETQTAQTSEISTSQPPAENSSSVVLGAIDSSPMAFAGEKHSGVVRTGQDSNTSKWRQYLSIGLTVGICGCVVLLIKRRKHNLLK